jgi:hypothetical protein
LPGNADVETIASVRKPASGSWGAEEPTSAAVATNGIYNGYANPQIGTDDNGAALVAWDYFDATSRYVQVNYSAAGSGWSASAAQILNVDPTQMALNINLHMRRDGTAWAVWSERTFKDVHYVSFDLWAIFAARFTPGIGWSAAEKVAIDLPPGIFISKIATSSAGNPMVMYEHQSGGNSVVYATTRNPAGVWSPAVTVVNVGNNNGFPPEPDFAMDGAGNAIAIWLQYDGVRYAVVSRRYTPGGGWESPIQLTLPSNDNGHAPRIAMDTQGNAFALWHEFDGSSFAIWAARYDRTQAWVTLQVISSPAAFADDSTLPQIEFDASGNAVAVWTKIANNANVVRANSYKAGAGWVGDETISTGNGPARLARVAVSPSGSAVATWAEQDTGSITPNVFRYWSVIYTP